MNQKHIDQMILGMQLAMWLLMIYSMLFICPFAFIGYPSAVVAAFGFFTTLKTLKQTTTSTIYDEILD